MKKIETVLVKEAEAFALQSHGSQKYGEHPYSAHLQNVVSSLYRYCPKEILTEHHVAAAWLHDTVEDTPVKISDIKNKFGQRVSNIVYAVTNELGCDRTEKTLKTLQKVRSTGKDAVIVKLADRIANTEFSMANHQKLMEEGKVGRHYKMYQDEYPIFCWALKNDSHGIDNMWGYLETINVMW